jgi:hypothetical protein
LGSYIPLIFILLSEKTERIYEFASNEILSLVKFSPNIIICDFELALINACKKQIPTLFYMVVTFIMDSRSTEKIIQLGLSKKVLKDIIFKKSNSYIFKLAFFEENIIDAAYKHILEVIENLILLFIYENLLFILKILIWELRIK